MRTRKQVRAAFLDVMHRNRNVAAVYDWSQMYHQRRQLRRFLGINFVVLLYNGRAVSLDIDGMTTTISQYASIISFVLRRRNVLAHTHARNRDFLHLHVAGYVYELERTGSEFEVEVDDALSHDLDLIINAAAVAPHPSGWPPPTLDWPPRPDEEPEPEPEPEPDEPIFRSKFRF